MKKKLHCSRSPKQIAKDSAFLRKVGLAFENTPSGFSRLLLAERKEKIVDRLIAIEFDGAKDPEVLQLWEANLKELGGA